MEDKMRLAVNVDHFATLREARRSDEPDPVLTALLAEQAGAEGIVCHIRRDRRHIKERDLRLFRETIKTKLNIEMSATQDTQRIALEIKPDVVSMVPEREEELTTEGGLDVLSQQDHLSPFVKTLQSSGIKVSVFVDPYLNQIDICHKLGVDLIEINTGKYAELKPGSQRVEALQEIKKSAQHADKLGLEVHAGHGLDYRNIHPLTEIPQLKEFSIGFAVVARAAIVGIEKAVKEMINLIQ